MNLWCDHMPQMGNVDRHQKDFDPLHLPLHVGHSGEVLLHVFLDFFGGSDTFGGVLRHAHMALVRISGIDVCNSLPCIVQGTAHVESCLTHTVVSMQGLARADMGEMPAHGKFEQVRAEFCQALGSVFVRGENNVSRFIHDAVQRVARSRATI